MNADPNDSRDDDDDALDRLLSQARWPAPTPLVQARLHAKWSAYRRRRRLMKFASFATAAAAAIVAIVSTSILLRQPQHYLVATQQSPGPKYLMNSPDQFAPREPNVVERLVMMQKSAPHAVKSDTLHAIPPRGARRWT